MPQFLSDEWMTEARKLREEFGEAAPAPTHSVRVNLVVTEVPFGEGTVNAHIDTSGGGIELETEHLENPEATVTMDWVTAKAILVDADPQAGMQAFMAGKVRIAGDMTKIMAIQQGPGGVANAEDAKKLQERLKAITD